MAIMTISTFSNPNEKTQIKIIEIEGDRYLDIRKYFESDNGETKPTRKGIVLKLEQAKMLKDLLNDKWEEIVSALSPGPAKTGF